MPLDDIDLPAPQFDFDLVAVDRAIERLEAVDARKARVVELRFFGGLSMDETAQALGVSLRSVYVHFEDLDDLFLAAASEQRSRVFALTRLLPARPLRGFGVVEPVAVRRH